MSNVYQSKTAEASPTPCVPDQVMISLGEIAESAKEGLLALAVGAGLQVMYAMMDADVAALAGPKGRHQPDRAAVRHGGQDGSVTLGGRRVAVRRPRVRAADGSGEVRVPSYELFAGSEVLGRMAMERMLAGPGCLPAATAMAWNRSVSGWPPSRRPRVARRSPAGSWPPPSTRRPSG